MTNVESIPGDDERLKRVLDRLEIEGGHTPAGTFLAFSVTEPLFCHERDTVEELAEVVAYTLKSYVETFYQVENLEVRVKSETRDIPTVPVERIEPTLRLLPSFGEAWGSRELAGAQ